MPYKSTIHNGQTDDQVLLERIASGDHIAFSELYEKYVRQLTQYGLKFTSDIQIVEDSLHDLFVWIWNKRKELEISYSLKSYLIKSIRTTILQKISRRQKQVLFNDKEDAYVFGLFVSTEDQLIDAESYMLLKEQVATIMACLTSKQREVIYLRYYEGLSFDEIAQNMDLSIKACYKLMGRAITEFKKAWQPCALCLINAVFLFP